MTATNPPKRQPNNPRNLKLLLATLSVTTTLSGWALLALTQPPPDDTLAASADATDPPTAQATLAPTLTPQPTSAPRVEVIIPALSSLPVRGLREIGDDPVQPAVAPQVVMVAAPQPSNNGGGGGGGGGQPPAPAPAPKPAPKPAPGGKTHGSHP